MNRIAPITVKLVSIYGLSSEDKLQQVFNRIFLKAQQNILARKKINMGLARRVS